MGPAGERGSRVAFAGKWLVGLGVGLGAGLGSGAIGLVEGWAPGLGNIGKELVGLLIECGVDAAITDTVTFKWSLTGCVDCLACSSVRSMERSI